MIATLRNILNYTIQLNPNQTVNIPCYTDSVLNYQATGVVVVETEDSYVPNYIEVTPAVVQFEQNKTTELTVTLSNLTGNTVNIAPRSVIAEIQPVVVDICIPTDETIEENNVNLFNLIHIRTNYTSEQETELKDLL